MKIFHILSLFVIFAFYSCRQETPSPCIEEPTPNDYVEPQHLWMNRHEIGDTLLFNRYHVDIDSAGKRKYRFTAQEQYIATDTSTVRISDYVSNPIDDCNIHVNRQSPTLFFKGKQKLIVQLIPLETTARLIVYFSGKEFQIGDNQYNYPDNFYPTYNIEGREFSKVNHLIGYNEGNWAKAETYKDSTFTFYNYDYGLLKFIINDTLVLQRVITE